MNNELLSELARMVAEHMQRPLPEGSAQDDGAGDRTSSSVHSMDTDSAPVAAHDAPSQNQLEDSIVDFLNQCHEPGNSVKKLDNIYPHPS
ncbi:hypothetical protein GQ54DRAFT_315074, partial [Martensiomyces pterosporus]